MADNSAGVEGQNFQRSEQSAASSDLVFHEVRIGLRIMGGLTITMP